MQRCICCEHTKMFYCQQEVRITWRVETHRSVRKDLDTPETFWQQVTMVGEHHGKRQWQR